MPSSTANNPSTTGIGTPYTNQLLQCWALETRRCVADVWTKMRFFSSIGVRWASRVLSWLLRSSIAVKNCEAPYKMGSEQKLPSPTMPPEDNISDRIKGPYTGPERITVESDSGSWQGEAMRPHPHRDVSGYSNFELQAAALYTQVPPETVAEVLTFMNGPQYTSAEGLYPYDDHEASTSGDNQYLTSPEPQHRTTNYFHQHVTNGPPSRFGLDPINIPQPSLLSTPSPVPGVASPSSTTSTWSRYSTSATASDFSPSSPLFDRASRTPYSPGDYSPLANYGSMGAHGHVWPPTAERLVSPLQLQATDRVGPTQRQNPRFREKVTSEATARAARLKRKKEATFCCEICGEMLTAKHNLTRHVNAHRGVKPFGCACGASFTTKADRKRHLKTHIQSTCRELSPERV
ncbi:hypothetical protein AB1N83_011346 [Pleurotus pulmonarius]